MSFKHKTPIQVRFKDIDALGHVNNANHLTYLELARISYFNAVIGHNINWNEKGIILARVIMDFKMPVMLNDDVHVYTTCSKIGTKSFELEYLMIKDDAGKEITLASATTVMVCYDYSLKRSMPMPPEWKEKLQKFENA